MKHKTSFYYEQLKSLRYEVKIQIDKAYKNLPNESERKIGGEAKAFWNNSKIPGTMKDENITYTKAQGMVDVFALFLKSIYTVWLISFCNSQIILKPWTLIRWAKMGLLKSETEK